MDRRGIAVFALTEGGLALARRVTDAIGGTVWMPVDLPGVTGAPRTDRTFTRVGPALQEAFGEAEAVVCVMATGVVIRSLAPVLAGKLFDPAVICLDEQGRFVIPLLAGHVGGANALARVLSRALGAQAVVTTSSDVQGLLGPDTLADVLDAHVADVRRLLPVSAALVNHRDVEVRYDPDEVGTAAAFLDGLTGYRPRAGGPETLWGTGSEEGGGLAVVVTARSRPEHSSDAGLLQLVPRWTVAGVGCKRGTTAAVLVEAVRAALAEASLHPKALRGLASVGAKRGEAGLLAAAEELGIPVAIASDAAIEETMAAYALPENAFVRASVGIGAAAEPAALWAAGPGATLILPKQAGGGVTVALARAEGGTMVRPEEARWTP